MKQRDGRNGIWPTLVMAATVCLFATSPRAADTFNPSVSVGYGYTDNVGYLGNPDEDTSDTATNLQVLLPWIRNLNRSDMRLSYRGDWYGYTEATEFDGQAHRARFDYDRRTRKGSRLRVLAGYVSTTEQFDSLLLPVTDQRPDQQEDTDPTELNITDRTTRETFDGAFAYDWLVGRKWEITTAVNGSRSTFEGGEDVEDRRTYGASLGLRSATNSRTFLEGNYRYFRTDLEFSGDEDFHGLGMRLRHRLTRTTRLDVRAGGFARVPDQGETVTGFFGLVSLASDVVAGPVRFSFGAGVSPSPGGSLAGTALTYVINGEVAGVKIYPLNWRVVGYYTRRDPFDSFLSVVETKTLRAGIEPAIQRLIALRITASYVEQTSADPDQEGSFVRAGVALVVYPLGRTRLAGPAIRTKG